MEEVQTRLRTPSATAELLRVFGYFSLITGVACCALLFVNIRARFLVGASNLSFLGYIGAYALIAGLGTVRLTRWGVIMLSAPLAVAGVIVGVLAVRQQQTMVAITLAIAWLILLALPALFAVRSWRELKRV